MPTPANAINESTTGIVKFDGASSFSATALTPYCVLVGNTSNNITSVGPGTAGQAFQAKGVSANPAYTTATYPSTASSSGKILIEDGTNWVASTPAYPNAASTSGKVIVSDGTNFVTSTPTFPNASATSRKIIVSDGTNWVASTETYATPGSSGNVMTSNGTNWVSSAPAGGGITINSATATITNAQLKAATAVQIVAAQGAGTHNYIVSAQFKLNYGGTNAFTNNPLGGLGNGNSASNWILGPTGTTFWQATSSQYYLTNMPLGKAFTASVGENAALYWTLSAALTGNAANDNTITLQVYYYTVTM
jgi:hypothetical protein